MVRSIRRLQQRLQDLTFLYRLVSTRLRDHEDAASAVRRPGDKLDDDYVLQGLRRLEQALDDTALVAEYTRLRGGEPYVLAGAAA